MRIILYLIITAQDLKKIIFINQNEYKNDFEKQNIGGKVINEIKSRKRN